MNDTVHKLRALIDELAYHQRRIVGFQEQIKTEQAEIAKSEKRAAEIESTIMDRFSTSRLTDLFNQHIFNVRKLAEAETRMLETMELPANMRSSTRIHHLISMTDAWRQAVRRTAKVLEDAGIFVEQGITGDSPKDAKTDANP